jgi:hypothetical protein
MFEKEVSRKQTIACSRVFCSGDTGQANAAGQSNQ